MLIWSDPWFDVESAARLLERRCELTTDRACYPSADAVIFPLPTIGYTGNAPPPLRGHPEQCWVAWCAECSVHFPALEDARFIDRFDLSMTYRFTIAFENAIGEDYVTEKFFDPLRAGSVPVYRGAPNVADFAPGERCYVDATAFPGPYELARFLAEMTDEEYGRYHEWRQRPLSPEFTRRCEHVAGHALERLLGVLPVIQFGRRARVRRRGG